MNNDQQCLGERQAETRSRESRNRSGVRVIASIIYKLESEFYELQSQMSAIDQAYRTGHNDRNRSLLVWIRAEMLAHELRAQDLDEPMRLELRQALISGECP